MTIPNLTTTGLLLDGVFASEAIDSSGEILDITGLDINDFDEGRGLANYEHKGHEGDSNGQEIVGKIIFSKKLMKESDCANDRERMFWNKVRLPLLYGVVRLYDGAGHEGAKALAAIIRDSHANNEPIIVGFSIEGSTLDKKDNRLLKTIARRVALTMKPCNKTAVSALMADPNAPDGYDKSPLGTGADIASAAQKGEIEDPRFRRLGGSTMEYGGDMLKTLTAGSYNAAPGTLTGGAALQVEDRSRVHKAVAQAALRDWNKTEPFRPFLKAKLPEASDEFLDHFAGLVENHLIRVKKTEEAINDLKKAGKPIAKTPAAPATSMPKKRVGGLTVLGQPVKTNPKLKSPKFDEKKGVLHTSMGSFKMYIPGQDAPEHAASFHKMMSDPKIEAFHGYAMDNWVKAHKLFKVGKVPPEVLMHGVLFSQLSPNTPVPMQEMMYGHLVDAMGHTGLNPRTANPTELEELKTDWMNRDQPQKFPSHSPEHWKRLEGLLRNKMDSKLTGRKAGDIGSFMLANNKFKNMAQYGTLHGALTDLLQRHVGDARSAAGELMHHKLLEKQHDNLRRTRISAGQPDIGDYPGIAVPGLAPKTTRYTLGMIGGGNVQVPDTHFARYLFGLDRGKDTNTIQHIKNVLWDPRNSHILEGIDRHYAANHDAVKYMLNHPKYGSVFEKPEDAIFPAFWRNWMAIVPHEKSRGLTSNGFNELTDHRPFWEAISPFTNVKKAEYEEANHDLAAKTAKIHANWVTEYGEIPASMMYYRHLFPKLLEAAANREAQTMVRKMQGWTIDFKKAEREGVLLAKGIADPNTEEPVDFNGRKVRPGTGVFVQLNGNMSDHDILGFDGPHAVLVPDRTAGRHHPSDMIRVPKSQVHVRRWPEHVDSPGLVDSTVDGVDLTLRHPDVHEMVHGFNFKQSKAPATSGAFRGSSYWAKAPNGEHVYVKSQEKPDDWHQARKEAVYHNVARDIFGLGHMLPKVGLVKNPATGEQAAIISKFPGAFHADEDPATAKKVLTKLWHSGELDKAAIMNIAMSNHDRHVHNWMVSDKGLHLIDHNMAMHGAPAASIHYPHYLKEAYRHTPGESIYNKPLHPEAIKWVAGLDPDKFADTLLGDGVPKKVVKNLHQRLVNIKEIASKHPNLTKLQALVAMEKPDLKTHLEDLRHLLGDGEAPQPWDIGDTEEKK